MTEIDDAIPEFAEALAVYGNAVDWHYPDSGKYYDQTTGGVTEFGATSVSVQITPPVPLELAQTAGTEFQAGDAEFYMLGPGLAFTPALTHQVDLDGDPDRLWSVVGLEKVTSTNTIQAWRVVVRR